MTISAVILTRKSELSPLLLSSLSFVDEILIIVDSPASSLKLKNKKIKIFPRLLKNDFSAQRNFALQKVKSDWVFFVDNDEYVGSELAREIQMALKNKKHSGYLIPRRDVVFHQPLSHGETGRTQILRLAKKDAGSFRRSVHEVWQVRGRVGEMHSPLYHLKDHFISEFIGRIDHYGPIDAQTLTGEGKPFSWWRLLFNPPAKFALNYFFRLGLLDGLAGLFQAYLMSVQSLSVRIFQWENQK